jgi:acyl-coenzyme A thioesterase PaaI-like protein
VASGSTQGFLSKFKLGATGMRRLLNLWPPFRGAGIRVRDISHDFREATVELRMQLLNRNYVGTHFGGSLYAMTDPFVMILMMQQLGGEYVVWDKAGAVRYIKPARGTVTARIEMPEARVAEARTRTADGSKFEPVFTVDIVDREGVTVAQVDKTLYIRRKREA